MAGKPSSTAGEMPFGSVEAFMFEVLTLRSQAAYREDVDLLYEYERDSEGRAPWTERFKLQDRPFQAARHVIGTWDLICRVLDKHVKEADLRAYFFEGVPLAAVYAWLRPALLLLAAPMKDPDAYASSFNKVGAEACKHLVAIGAGPVSLSKAPAAAASPQSQREFYRTIDEYTRNLTHFG